jgi:tetratricopeptide (TPR) repeat protein
MRTLYTLGLSYIGVCALSLTAPFFASAVNVAPAPIVVAVTPAPQALDNSPAGWFNRVKPSCNSVEVTVVMRNNPAPETTEGQGYAASCYALAGKIDLAKKVIDALPGDQRATASGVVFNIGHPIADAGDDNSAAPIMRLVIDYWPENYMALYHAGIAEYNLKQYDDAKIHLTSFLDAYPQEDGWRASAQAALEGMTTGSYPVLERLAG